MAQNDVLWITQVNAKRLLVFDKVTMSCTGSAEGVWVRVWSMSCSGLPQALLWMDTQPCSLQGTEVLITTPDRCNDCQGTPNAPQGNFELS